MESNQWNSFREELGAWLEVLSGGKNVWERGGGKEEGGKERGDRVT